MQLAYIGSFLALYSSGNCLNVCGLVDLVGIALEDAVIACLKARSALNQIAEQTTKWQLGFESTDIEGGMCRSCRLDHEGKYPSYQC